jgi:uncharacterized protein (TIGR03437 family)
MRRHIFIGMTALALAGVARADLEGQNISVSANSRMNLDTGKVVTSGGDFLYTGSSIVFQGSATGQYEGLIGVSGYQALTKQVLQSLPASSFSSATISKGLSTNVVILVKTNGGNVAKFFIGAAVSSLIITVFDTYGNTGGTNPPAITDVVNNSSSIPNGFPNSGIAPSTLFVIHGSNLADPSAKAVLQDTSKGLPTTLNGATLSATVNGTTVKPAIYYAIASQIAAVLPANTPVGSGTLTVSYNGTASSAFSILVVPTAYGIDVYNGNTAVATDAVTGALITPTTSAQPGQVLVIWGTGLGADAADSDTTFTPNPHAIDTQLMAYIGGIQVSNIAFAGGSVFPGVHVIGLTVPSGIPNGCNVPIVFVTGGNIVSNSPTIAVMDSGGVCSDPLSGADGSIISGLNAQSTVRSGSVIVGQSTSASGVSLAVAFATFQSVTGASYTGAASSGLGACKITQTLSGGSTSSATGLNAGSVTVTIPSGSTTALTSVPQVPGEYFGQLDASAIPSAGGSFTFKGTGASGATAVGPFTASVNFPDPLISWTNQSDSSAVRRTDGQTFTWTGGAPGSYVVMTGSSTSGTATASYTCVAPVSAGQFTVPPYILFALPAGKGSTAFENATSPAIFAATGLDYGFAIGFVTLTANTTFQ